MCLYNVKFTVSIFLIANILDKSIYLIFFHVIGARHILTTELRSKFVPFMEKLFDEDILLGKGWTTHESLRPLAYSTLADLVHHVRQSLPLSDLERAVALFR